MPKTRRRPARVVDRYYQDWHFERILEVIDTQQEFKVQVPRPLQAPPAGRYYAVELHSIEFYYKRNLRAGQAVVEDIALTFSPRLGKTPFLTHAGHRENLFWHHYECIGVAGLEYFTSGSGDKVDFTDNLGHGKLITGDNIWLQLSSTLMYDTLLSAGFSCQYTYTTVPCNEYVQALAEQLTTF
ncbi:unnamed protein product [marine sediment metagenome]|uniref:Uncharacterized protein n=1 Tax=marine sediment metagenome TaxID=412755 RepID=X1BXS7_9ZZZZ